MEYLREAELKHGRLAMLAWFGWASVDLGVRFPFSPTEWADINSPSALNLLMKGEATADYWYTPIGYLTIAFVVSEWREVEDITKMREGEEASRVAGDLGCDFLQFLKDKSDEEVAAMKLKELKHARLGMIAMLGVLVQSTVVGADAFPYIQISA